MSRHIYHIRRYSKTYLFGLERKKSEITFGTTEEIGRRSYLGNQRSTKTKTSNKLVTANVRIVWSGELIYYILTYLHNYLQVYLYILTRTNYSVPSNLLISTLQIPRT